MKTKLAIAAVSMLLLMLLAGCGSGKNRSPTVQILNPADGAEVTVGEDIRFTAHATDPEGKALAFSWNFGDNFFSSEVSPSHAYQHSGNYTVILTVTDPEKAQATARVIIHVIEPITDISGTWEVALLNTEWTGAGYGTLEIYQIGDRLEGTLSTTIGHHHASGNRVGDKIILDVEHDIYAGRHMTLEGTLQSSTGITGHYWLKTELPFDLPLIGRLKLGTRGEWYAQKLGSQPCARAIGQCGCKQTGSGKAKITR